MAVRPARAALHPAALPAADHPWLIRFWRASLPDRYRHSLVAQGSLMRFAAQAMEGMVAAAGLASHVRRDGNLQLYESEAELAASQPGWDARAKEGVEFEHVRGSRLAELQPGIAAALRRRHLHAALADGGRPLSFRPRAVPGGDGPRRRDHPWRGEGGRAGREWRSPALRRRLAARRRACGARRRRLVAPAGARTRRRRPAGDRARLQHHFAARRLRFAPPAHLRRPRLRGDAALHRHPRRRRGRARRAQGRAELPSAPR